MPGEDPNGPPGQAQAGRPAYLWARVRNHGPQNVKGAVVEFWWANPALQVTRTLANLVGVSVVDVDAGTAMDVLCVTPWVPVTVNDGHECLVVAVISAADPLPTPLPDVFDPPTYPQVAQRNLTVLPASSGLTMLTLTVAAAPRRDKQSVVRVSVGTELSREAVRHLGLARMQMAAAEAVRAGITLGARRCEPDEGRWSERLEIQLSAGTAVPVQLFLRSDLAPGEFQIVHVVESDDSGDIGGFALAVISPPTDEPIDGG